MLSFVTAADTPGEVAVKDAIKTLKEKRATVKDKADQALLDTTIKDLEERLAQVGKGEPEPEAKKEEPFVMPKGWELKFNTGKARPTYNAKTGVLKLVYDFSDAKQLKDFDFDKDVKPKVQKALLTIQGGDEIKHVARFRTICVACVLVIGAADKPLSTSRTPEARATTAAESRKVWWAGFGNARAVSRRRLALALTQARPPAAAR